MTDESIHEAVVDVFKSHGFGPFDLEAVIAFTAREFAVTPFTYIDCHERIKQYILKRFECVAGSLKGAEQLGLRRTLVYYQE